MRYKLLLLVSVSLILGGCAYNAAERISPGWDKGAAQPRALLHSINMPSCTFFCFMTVSINEAESAGGNFSGGDIREAVSPSLNLGTGNAIPVVPQ